MKGQITIDNTQPSNKNTCIFTCEKGIYETHKLEVKRRINYSMLPRDGFIVQMKLDRGNKKICISF